MGGSLGYSGSDSESESEFSQDVWGGQQPALQNLYGNASDLFNTTNMHMQAMMPGNNTYMNQVRDMSFPGWQNQMAGGAYRDMGLQNQLTDSLNQSLNNPSAMSEINAMIMGGDGNNYADAMKQQYMDDANQAHKMMMSNTNLGAIDAGQSGSSRHGVMQGLGSEAITDNLQTQLANTGFSTFDKDLDRKLQIASQADQGTLARQQLMGNMIGEQNTAMQGGLDYGQNMQSLGLGSFAPLMMPWQAMGNYANTLGQPTILGSGSMSGESSSDAASASGGIGGGK